MRNIQSRVPQLTEQRDELIAEARALLDEHPAGLDTDQQARYDGLVEEIEQANTRITKVRDLEERFQSGNIGIDGPPQVATRTEDPFQSPGRPESVTEVRSRALTAVERWKADDRLKQSATRHLERLDADDTRGVAGHLLRYSNPLYVSAFRKYSQDPETFAAELTPDERRAWSEARDHQRSTLGTAGAVLPSPLDPTVVLTNDADVDPMRSVARVDSTVSTSKRYITSEGTSFEFAAEMAESPDSTPALAEVEIDVEKAQGFIQASIEAAMDQPGFEAEVTAMIADGKARLEAAKFVSGSGTNEPRGIVTALTGTTAEVDADGEDLVADDVYELLEKLPPRFRQRAAWQLELSTLNRLGRLYNPSGNEPPLIEGSQLLRRPYVENSNLDPYSAIDPEETATHRPLIVGDWRQFIILDRVGMSVSYLAPGILKGTNDRPDGRVGWYAYWRTGSGILTTNAWRMLKVSTTA